MRPRITSTAGAGSVTTVLAVVLWLAVQAGTAGGETPFPVSDWAGPSYGRDARHPLTPPLAGEISGDAVRDRLALATPAPGEPGDEPPDPQPTVPPPAPSPTPTPTQSASPLPTRPPSPTPTPAPSDTPSPPRRYAMEVTIGSSRTSARPGESIRYTIHVTNTGTDTLRNIKAETHVPAGTTRAECTGSGSFAVCTGVADDSGTGHVETWIGTLGSGETFTYTMDVIVKNTTDKGTKLRNHAHGVAPDTGRVSSKTISVLVV